MDKFKKMNTNYSPLERGKGVCKYKTHSFFLNFATFRFYFLTALIISLFLSGGLLPAQTSLNNQPLDSTINPSDFTFIVTGHIYGDGSNQSGFPASTFLANLENIEKLNPAFIWFTGDVFRDIENDFPNYQRSLFTKIDFPLYNAVGNHDLTGDFYQENIGDTWYSFSIGNSFFITLDSEYSDSKIDGEQLGFFTAALENAESAGIKNVFITSHRPIWAETNPEFAGLFSENTRSVFGDNFVNDIQPLLKKYEKDFSIFWFSGSMGNGPASFFYHQDVHVTFIQSAIRNQKRDAVLKVKIKQDRVSFETISLTGQQLEPLENYNLEYWKDYRKPVVKFNYRLIPLYIKQMFISRYFWYGMGLMLLIVFGVSRIRNRLGKND